MDSWAPESFLDPCSSIHGVSTYGATGGIKQSNNRHLGHISDYHEHWILRYLERPSIMLSL